MSGDGPTPTEMHKLLVVEDDHCIAITPDPHHRGCRSGQSGRDR